MYTVSSSLQHSSGAVALHDDDGGGDGGSLSTTRPSGSLPGSGKVPSKDPLPYKEFFSFDKLDLKQWPAFQTAYGLQHSYLDNTQLSCLGARKKYVGISHEGQVVDWKIETMKKPRCE